MHRGKIHQHSRARTVFLRRLRNLKLSQIEFALLFGRDPTTVCKWGKNGVPLPESALRFLESLETEQLAKSNILVSVWRGQQVRRFIQLSPEAQEAANYVAKRGYRGDPGDPLPTFLTEQARQEIKAKPDWFKLAVHMAKFVP